MTLDEYISNPMGKNNATFTPFMRESIKGRYKVKFDNILLRENGKIDFYQYYDKNKNCYYVHVKVPSEVVNKFYYDVVFKFFTTSDSNTEGGSNLEKYDVQFFSNDPAFVFTHAHTFMEKGLFLNECAYRMSKEAIKRKATVTNPNDSVGYVKSIYFAYLFLKGRGLLKTITYKSAESYDQAIMLSRIMDADLKIKLRQDEEDKRDKRKKLVVDKNLARKLDKYDLSDRAKSKLVTTTKRTSTTGKVKKTKAVNSIKKK